MDISVVIPVFNREKEIIKCLESILQQSMPVSEILVIDDGSTDRTLHAINSFQDNRIKLFHSGANRGPSYARNIGINSANSDWIAFLDSDDEWGKDRVRNLNQFLKENEVDCVYSGANINDGSNFRYRNSRDLLEKESIFDFVIAQDAFIPTPSLVLRSWIAKAVKFDEKLDRHEDFDFIVRANAYSKWKYFESDDVIINWMNRGNKRVDFTGCVNFYLKNKKLSTDKAARIGYLKSISEMSVKNNPQLSVLELFENELISECVKLNKREFLLFRFPHIFHAIWRLKNRIKLIRE
ncbi:glycosyltransferase family 2 protein [Fontibacter flavus]|uniref:Glycosyltransferase family 2 protein n=1 Tax=Fontibacter flavus TaxID=654838 RepID=A0ABV6FUD4_9BACT